MKTIRNRIVGGLALLVFQLQYLSAQVPTHLPGKKPEPVPMTPVNIIILILIPLGLLVFYIWWLRQNRKKAEEKRASEEKDNEKEG
jgi:membrane protein DedA with SNARE-associated domain